jgi:hypothetical protein
MKIKLYHCKGAHWKPWPNGVRHGPQSWPWWRLVSPSIIKLDVHSPSFGWRLWLYTRWGAWCGDVYVDRRPSLGETGDL